MIYLDAGDLIGSLSTGTYTVTRRAAATYVAGILTPGATSTLSIVAAVVPATGRDLERLPEARRSVETRAVFTATALKIGAQAAPYESDLVSIEGDSWEVQHLETWPGLAGYYRAIVQRKA